MRADRSSGTAAMAALWRALGEALPAEVRLVADPADWLFVPAAPARLRVLTDRFPGLTGRLLLATPLRRLLLWMQLRTRAIDAALDRFVGAGGRQVVLLGAGFDTRAVRRARGARFFEVDHPATQARKQRLLAGAGRRSAAAEPAGIGSAAEPTTEADCRTDDDCVFSRSEEIGSADECRVECCAGAVVGRAVAERFRAWFDRWCAGRAEALRAAAGCEQAICEVRGDPACVGGVCVEVGP